MQLQTSPPVFYHFSSPHCSISVCSLACEKSTYLHLPHYPMWTFTCLLRPVQNASVKHSISVNVPFSMIFNLKKKKNCSKVVNKDKTSVERDPIAVIYYGWWVCFFPVYIKPTSIPVIVVCIHMYYFYHLVFINDFVASYILNRTEFCSHSRIFFKERMG